MRSTTEKGHRGEQIAADFLRQNGYQILENNVFAHRGEIDLIAEEQGVLCLVEVRSRETEDHGNPLETLSPQKRSSLIRAARELVSARGWEERVLRFDVVGIVYQPTLSVTLIRDAFQVDR